MKNQSNNNLKTIDSKVGTMNNTETTNEIETMRSDIRKETIVPKILGAAGIITASPMFLSYFVKLSNDIYFYSVVKRFDFYLFKILPSEFFLFIIPVLLGLIGILKIKNKPILSGSCMLTGGIITIFGFLNFLLFHPNYFLAAPGSLLIVGGALTLMRYRKIKE